MRNLLRSRRGSAAFATVIALVPLIGVVALGAEAGSWYVTRQHAQDAADSAAMAGAMTIAIQNANNPNIPDSHTYDYRGKEFAAQNTFCNSGDTTGYPGSNCATSHPKGISQTVQIDRGTFDVATNTWTSSAGGSFVRATVSQQQPAYLAAVLGLTTVNIGARAIAEVLEPQQICALALAKYPSNSAALTLAGSVNFTGTGCAIASDNTVKYASTPTFTGSGWSIDAVNGCVNSGNCNPGVPYNYTMLPAAVPPQLQNLNSESFNTRTGNANPETSISCTTAVPPLPAGTTKCFSMAPNASGAYGNLTVTTGHYVNLAPGTYFFYNANIKLNGGTVTCTSCTSWTGSGVGVTLVLLGNSSISIAGGAKVNLSASKTNTTSSDLNGVLIDDQAPNGNNNAVTINGGGTVALGGAMYFPNVDVTWSGTIANANTTCSEVIANSLTMSGGANLSSQGCPPLTVAHTQVVALVH
jgi:hypothetical protein